MNTSFNERKATQLAAIVLDKIGGKMDVLDLMKILYYIDRQAFLKFRVPFTGDTYVSMTNGMVLSETYDLAKGRPHFPTRFWAKHIERVKDSFELRLIAKPEEIDEFSAAERTFIEEMLKECENKDRHQLIEMIHHKFPEWIKPPEGTKRVLIEHEEMLAKAGLRPDEIDKISHKVEVRSMFESVI